MRMSDRAASCLELMMWLWLAALLATGAALGPHYAPVPDQAFQSVEQIMREVEGGWLLRYTHGVSTSLLFSAFYLYVFVRLFSEPHSMAQRGAWSAVGFAGALGLVAAFAGFVLPFSQMSYWMAVIAGSLAPGWAPLDGSVLARYLNVHVIAAMIMAVIGLTRMLPLLRHFRRFREDGLIALILTACLTLAPPALQLPHLGSAPDEFVAANPLVTPAHIVPEWWALPFYAILRSIPDKELGVAALSVAAAALFVMPWLGFGAGRAGSLIPGLRRLAFAAFVLAAFGLLILGALYPETPLFGGALSVMDASFALSVYALAYLYVLRLALSLAAWATSRTSGD